MIDKSWVVVNKESKIQHLQSSYCQYRTRFWLFPVIHDDEPEVPSRFNRPKAYGRQIRSWKMQEVTQLGVRNVSQIQLELTQTWQIMRMEFIGMKTAISDDLSIRKD